MTKEYLGLRYQQIVSVRFDPGLYAHMKLKALERRQRVSEFVREAVKKHSEYLEQ